MSDLIATSLAVAFGTRPLFEDVSLTIDPGDRIALVGPNGAGKTTLLRALAGTLTPTAGTVRVPDHLHVALHDQRPERSAQRLRDFVAPPRMVELEERLRELEVAMAGGDPGVMRAYDDVRTRFDAAGGEHWRVRVDTVMRGLGFTEQQHEQPLQTLSGGELTRASLARALAGAPDVLLLDEPTNHLDMEAIDWLQEFLCDLPGGCVLVSHDRWFIESVCTSVVEIVGGRARRFRGSFVEYRTQQALEAVSHERQLERMKTEISRLQRFVDKFQAGTRSRQATSRVKMLERLRAQAPQYADLRHRRGLAFSLPRPERTGNLVFDVRGIELGFPADGDRPASVLLPATDLAIERGEKIALLGRNGSGKSTLLQALAAACLPLAKEPAGLRDGEIRVGYGVEARMLSQHDSELVDNQSMLGNMNLASPSIARRDAMNLLGLFGFGGDDGERLVSTLSGGERRRLLLAMALTGSANVLLLDEPTNHLDIESREALEAALSDFEGTVLLISHDRALVEGVATRTIVLHDRVLTTAIGGYTHARDVISGAASIPGTADDAAASGRRGSGGGKRAGTTGSPSAAAGGKSAAGPGAGRGAKSGAKPGAKTPAQPADQPGRRTVRVGEDGPRRRRGGSARGSIVRVRRPATIEREIEQMETRLAEVQELMLDPEVYTSPERAADALDEHAKLERDIAARYEELAGAIEHHGE